MTYTYTWDETKPAGTRAINLGDDDIREFKSAIRERLAGGGMNFPSSDDANAGLYNYVKFIEQSSDPTAGADRGFLFTKDVSGVTELYWMDSAGSSVQLTSAGKILLTSLGSYAARGDMIRGGASGWERTALGTSGKVWKSDGTDAAWGDINFQTAASQAEMEAASEITVPVTPGRAQYHPGVAKAWVNFTGTGTVTINASYNVTSVSDNGTGDYSVNFTTAFSSVNYCAIALAKHSEPGDIAVNNTGGLAVGSARLDCRDTSNVVQDKSLVFAAFFGDQ